MNDKTTREPCVICQGNGTRGQMRGGRMYVIDCEICDGTGWLPVMDIAAYEAAKDRYGE